MLFGCIHVPDFPVQAALRVDSKVSFKTDMVAVMDGPESQLKVFSCNVAARRAGINPGMTKTQAEACPNVSLRKRVVEQEESAQSALLDCGYGFSPRVESTCPGTITIELTGAERLLGSQETIAHQLVQRAMACGCFEVTVALAANPDTALHAARGFTGTCIIAHGEEARRLECLPIEVLQPPEEILDALNSWGIRDFKALAALPAIPLTQRLGQHGLHLQRLARGEVQRELILTEPAIAFRESMELEEAVELLEPLAFVLNRLLEQVTARLVARSLATDHVQVDLALEAHVDRQLKTGGEAAPELHYQRALKLPVPTQEAKFLLKLLQLDLAADPPQAPVKKVKVEAFPAHVRFGQGGLFQPLAPEPAKLEITMARLRAVVGEKDEHGRARVGFPAVLDSHKPDSFQVLPFNAERKESKKRSPATPKTRFVLRVFRPPLPAKVELNCDVPSAVMFSGRRVKVENASGPWRSSGSWWDKTGEWRREEWDVEFSINGGTGIYRVFRELPSGQWFVEGMYD